MDIYKRSEEIVRSEATQVDPAYPVPLHIVHFCAKECKRQRSRELSVARMVDAWAYLKEKDPLDLHLAEVLTVGFLVDPRNTGVRKVGVTVAMNSKLRPEFVPKQLEKLVANYKSIHPDDFFYEFEEIHPFIDGNGRSGNLLWNFMKYSLDDPSYPPDFWGIDPLLYGDD